MKGDKLRKTKMKRKILLTHKIALLLFLLGYVWGCLVAIIGIKLGILLI